MHANTVDPVSRGHDSRSTVFLRCAPFPLVAIRCAISGPTASAEQRRGRFATKADARRWLTLTESDIARGAWVDESSDGEMLSVYAARWIVERPGLSERSMALYSGLLRLHIAPQLGAVGLRRIAPAYGADLAAGVSRRWRRSEHGVEGVPLAARGLNTAFDDELIRRNPCRIKGAGVEHPAERPVLTLDQVMSWPTRSTPRYRMLVLLAVFASLRWGELMGLRQDGFRPDRWAVRVERSVVLDRC